MADATDTAGTPRGQTSDDILRLPFVRDLDHPRPETGTSRHFWTPRCEGLDYAAGFALGQDYALQALRFMAAHRMSPLLGWAVLDMAGEQPVGGAKGVIVGFCSVFATLALQAAGDMDRVEQAFAERRRQAEAVDRRLRAADRRPDRRQTKRTD